MGGIDVAERIGDGRLKRILMLHGALPPPARTTQTADAADQRPPRADDSDPHAARRLLVGTRQSFGNLAGDDPESEFAVAGGDAAGGSAVERLRGALCVPRYG